jgi:hypothetical protein
MEFSHEQMAAITEYGERIYEEIIKDESKRNPERLAKVSPEKLAAFKTERIAEGKKLAEKILDKSGCYCLYKNYRFNVNNQNSRRLFHKLTGIVLPPTNGKTDAVLREYIGESYIKQQEELARQENQRKLDELKDKMAKEEVEKFDKIKNRMLAGDSIGGDELADFARYLGLVIPPRTVGMLRTKISTIKQGTATVNKNLARSSSDTAHRIYREVLAKIS